MEKINQEQQELMFKLAMYEQQIMQLQQQIQAVEQAIVDLNSLNFGVGDLEGKKGKKIFAPIGKGIFAKAELISENLLVDIGGKNLVEKSIPETKKLLERQIGKLKNAQKELNQCLEDVGREVEMIV